MSADGKKRFRVTLWFNSSPQYGERFATYVAALWDDWPGITSQESELAEEVQEWRVLADPVLRPVTFKEGAAGGSVKEGETP